MKKNEVTQKLKQVELAIFDVDGVLTDGKLYFDDRHVEHKAFSVRDGLGIKLLMDNQIEVAIITGRKSESTQARLYHNLGIKHYYEGSLDKVQALSNLLDKLNISESHVLYVGDDLIDLGIMSRVGVAVAVNDAEQVVKDTADIVLTNKGGEGAVREVCEKILSAQDKWDQIIKQFKQGKKYAN